jgi:hypothetical protein
MTFATTEADVKLIMAELFSQSDRGCGIIGGAIIEGILTDLLKKRLIGGMERLFSCEAASNEANCGKKGIGLRRKLTRKEVWAFYGKVALRRVPWVVFFVLVYFFIKWLSPPMDPDDCPSAESQQADAASIWQYGVEVDDLIAALAAQKVDLLEKTYSTYRVEDAAQARRDAEAALVAYQDAIKKAWPEIRDCGQYQRGFWEAVGSAVGWPWF